MCLFILDRHFLPLAFIFLPVTSKLFQFLEGYVKYESDQEPTGKDIMKINIQIDDSLDECEVVIRTPELNNEVEQIQKALSGFNSGKGEIIFLKDDTEYYFGVDKILFFETDANRVMAHTATDCFEVRRKLYELEEMLPAYFLRVSKSTILNTRKVFGLTKNVTASSKVDFAGSKKSVYVSRNFYKPLKEMLSHGKEVKI